MTNRTEDIEELKLRVLDYLADNNIRGAVDYVYYQRTGLSRFDCMRLVLNVKREATPEGERDENDRY